MSSISVWKNGVQIKLTDKDFLTSGGEGSIYKKNNEIYKVYLQSIDSQYVKKLSMLSVLDKPNIIRPLDILYHNQSSIPVGFSMQYADNSEVLAKLFTTSFQNRNNIDNSMISTIIENMVSTIQFIHDKKVLIVDGNELNYLVSKSDFKTVYFIDVDAYQIAGFPAKVIMPSIRDYQSSSFTELTDWFSFAVISFQMYTGIHPFKGTHPKYPANDLKGRMQNNISVFNKEVSLPKPVRDIDSIPDNLREWYFNLFEKGKRSLPPQILGSIIKKAQEILVYGNNKLIIEIESSYNEHVLNVENDVVYTRGFSFIHKTNKHPYLGSIKFEINGDIFAVSTIQERLALTNVKTGHVFRSENIESKKSVVMNNDIYILNEGSFSYIENVYLNDKVFSSIKNTWNVLPLSTKVYKNMLVSNVLGRIFFYIPSKNTCKVIPVKELDDFVILDAECQKDVVSIIAMQKGVYYRFLMIVGNSSIEKIARYSDIQPTETNFTVLPNGIILTLTANDEIYLNNRNIDTDPAKVLTDVQIHKGARLFSEGDKVKYFVENKIYSVRMK